MKRLIFLCILSSLFAFFSLGVLTTRIHAETNNCPSGSPFVCTSQIQQIIAQALNPIISSLQALQNQLAGDESTISQHTSQISNLQNHDNQQDQAISNLQSSIPSVQPTPPIKGITHIPQFDTNLFKIT